MFGIYRYQLVDGTYERVPITTTTTEHHYVTQNGKVVRETIGTGETAQVLDFIYDEGGKPFALIYTNGTAEPVTYYYVLNLQGDVVQLVEHTRKGKVYTLNTVAEYTYDAWGKPLSTTDGEGNSVANTHIAKLNPLRYRGYYFDMETGFYYLQSRYYDPTLRRFINADSLASTGQGILGTNMFAYCNNCPVAFVDHEGGYCSYAVQETGAGGNYYFPEVATSDEKAREFYYAEAKGIVESRKYAGSVISVDIRFDGYYETMTWIETIIDYVCSNAVEAAATAVLAKKIGGFPTTAVLFAAGLVYTLIDSSSEPDLPDGKYEVYTIVVTSLFHENGVQIEESVFYTFYYSRNMRYYTTDVWYSYPHPEQKYPYLCYTS